MERIGLIGLCKFELPGHDARICDGGFIEFDSEIYVSADSLLGSLAALEGMSEGTGDEVPALDLVLQPPAGVDPGDLAQPGWQTSRARFWIGEYDSDTGILTGTPDLLFDGQVDRCGLAVGETRELNMSVVSLAERLFSFNAGNTLNPNWHKSIWPGELGHDNATGLTIPVAWGAASPPLSSPTSSGGYDGGGGGSRYNYDSPFGAP